MVIAKRDDSFKLGEVILCRLPEKDDVIILQALVHFL
jgi:hypothetical protein